MFTLSSYISSVKLVLYCCHEAVFPLLSCIATIKLYYLNQAILPLQSCIALIKLYWLYQVAFAMAVLLLHSFVTFIKLYCLYLVVVPQPNHTALQVALAHAVLLL